MGYLDQPIEQTRASHVAPSATTLNTQNDSKKITIGLNSNKGVDLDKIDRETIQKIETYLYLKRDYRHWKDLSPTEKFDLYTQHLDGTLREKKTQEFERLRSAVQDCTTIDEAINTMLEDIFSHEDPSFNNLSEEEKQKKFEDKKAELRKIIKESSWILNKSDESGDGKVEELMLALVRNTYIGGGQLAKDFLKQLLKSQLFRDSITQRNDYYYQTWFPNVKRSTETEEPDATTKAQIEVAEHVDSLVQAEIDNGTSVVDANKNADQLYYNSLQAKIERGEELNSTEADNLQALRERLNRLGKLDGNSFGVPQSNSDNQSIIHSYLKNTLAESNTDAEISIKNLTEEQKQKIIETFLQDFNQCQTEEEKRQFLKEFYTSCNDAAEQVFAMEIVTKSGLDQNFINETIKELEKDEQLFNEVLESISRSSTPQGEIAESYIPLFGALGGIVASATEISSQTARSNLSKKMFADVAMNSHNFKGENQRAFITETVPEAEKEGRIDSNTLAHLSTTTIAEYEDENIVPAYQTLGDMGCIKNASPQIRKALEEQGKGNLIKDVTEAWASSEKMDTETKNAMFRDLIEFTDDEDLKNYFENLAKQHSIDYNSAPPHSERVATSSSTTNSSGENVANSSYNTYNTSNALNREGDPFGFLNVLTANIKNGIDGAIETLSTIFESPDAKPQQKLNSFDDALSALNEAGMQKLPKIFAQSSIGVKQELIKYVFTQNKDDIIPLIKSFGGVAIFTLTEGSSKKMFIYQETKKLAMNDSALKPDVKVMEQMLKKAQNGQFDLTVI